MKIKIVLFFCGLIFLNLAYAWNYSGHMVVAKIAYHHLSPQAKAEADRLTHLFDKQYPQTRGFVASSIWADLIRSHDIAVYDEWHYINQPIFSSAEFALNENFAQPKNVVWAISQSLRVLNSKRATDFEKAMFLRLLIHFVGDIHQPLHCTSFYSKSFPQGDKGGTLYPVISPHGNNLHVVWDRGLGYFKRYTGKDRIARMAKAIEKKYPMENFRQQMKIDKPAQWANECYQLSKKRAYTIPEKSVLSEQYIQEGQQLTQAQLALAGYRLAEMLNGVFREE